MFFGHFRHVRPVLVYSLKKNPLFVFVNEPLASDNVNILTYQKGFSTSITVQCV